MLSSKPVNLLKEILLVLETFGLECCVCIEVIFMVANLQTLGVPIKYCSLPGTVAAVLGVVLIPSLGIIMDRFARSTPSKARILVFVTVIEMSGALLVALANGCKLLEVTPAQRTVAVNATTINLTTITNSDSWTSSEEGTIRYYSILAMVGYALNDMGFDSSCCFQKTFALAVIPDKHQQSSIIVKSMIVASFGGCLISVLGVFGLGDDLTQGTDLDPNAAQVALLAGLCFLLVLIGMVSTLITGLCCAPQSDKTSFESSSHISEKSSLLHSETSYVSHVSRESLSISTPMEDKNPKPASEFSPKPRLTRSIHRDLIAFIKKEKSQILLNLGTFFAMSSIYSFEVYSANFAGVAIYGGDPSAPVLSAEYDLFLKGIKAGSTGIVIVYITFTLTVCCTEKLLAKIGWKAMMLVSIFFFSVTSLVCALTVDIWTFYVATATMGAARATSLTLPYVLANKFAREKKGSINSGVALSMVAAMLPAGFTVCSAIMGPLIDLTGSTVTPIYYAFGTSVLAFVAFAFLRSPQGLY